MSWKPGDLSTQAVIGGGGLWEGCQVWGRMGESGVAKWSGLERVAMLMRVLERDGFRGEVKTVYGVRGVKHLHVSLYLDLEMEEGRLREQLRRLGSCFVEMSKEGER